jgi:hypothetical protein
MNVDQKASIECIKAIEVVGNFLHEFAKNNKSSPFKLATNGRTFVRTTPGTFNLVLKIYPLKLL